MRIINKNQFVLFAIITLFILSFQLKAQNKAKDKLTSIKGDVSKITITADGKETTFEGEEAAELFKKLTKKEMKLEFISEEDDDITWIIDDDSNCGDIDLFTKEIKVELEDGVKKVVIKTNENGEEKTEVLEGKEAENFIEKMKDDNGEQLMLKFKKDKERKCIILKTDDEKVFKTDSADCVKIIMDDCKGVKKIKINKKEKKD